jgi:hypothetical protein
VAAGEIPPAVCDGCHNNVVEHTPRNAAEDALWSHFRHATRWYAVVMLVSLCALMAVLHAGYEPGTRLTTPIHLLLLPASLYFALNRFDVLPALLVGLSLAAGGRGRHLASGGFLAAATLLKAYPVLLVPPLLRFVSADRRSGVRWALGYGGLMLAFLIPTVALSDGRTVLAPYRFQLTRPAEDWTLFGYVLPAVLAQDSLAARIFRSGSVIAAALALVWMRPGSLVSVLRRGAVMLLVFLALQVFYSPQWVLWLTPLLVPLATTSRVILWLTVLLDLVTFLSFPVVFDLSVETVRPFLQALLIYLRFGLLATLTTVLLREEWTCARPRERGEPA